MASKVNQRKLDMQAQKKKDQSKLLEKQVVATVPIPDTQKEKEAHKPSQQAFKENKAQFQRQCEARQSNQVQNNQQGVLNCTQPEVMENNGTIEQCNFYQTQKMLYVSQFVAAKQQEQQKQPCCDPQLKIDQMQKQIDQAQRRCRFTNDQLRKMTQQFELCKEENQQIKMQREKEKVKKQEKENRQDKEKLKNRIERTNKTSQTSQDWKQKYANLSELLNFVNQCAFQELSKFQCLQQDNLLQKWKKIIIQKKQLSKQNYKKLFSSTFLKIYTEQQSLKYSRLELQNSHSQITLGKDCQCQELADKLHQKQKQLNKQQKAFKNLTNQKNQLDINFRTSQKQKNQKIEEFKKHIILTFKDVSQLNQTPQFKDISFNIVMYIKKQQAWTDYLSSLTKLITSLFNQKAQQIQGKDQQIKMKDQQIKQLNQKHLEINLKCQQLQLTCNGLKQQHKKLSQAIQKKQSQNQKVKQQAKQIEEKATKMQLKISQLQQSEKLSKQQIASTLQEKQRLQQSIKHEQNIKIGLEAKYQEIKRQSQRKVAQLNSLVEKQRTNSTLANEKFEQEKWELQQKIQILGDIEYKFIQSDKSNKMNESKVTDLTTRIGALAKQKERLEVEMSKFQKGVCQSNLQQRTLSQELEGKDIQIFNLKANNTQKDNTIQQLNLDLAKLHQQNQQSNVLLTEQKKALQQRLQGKNYQIHNLQTTIAQKNSNIEQSKSDLSNLRQQSQKNNARLTEQKKALSKELERLNGQILNLQAIINQNGNNANELNSDLTNLRQQLQSKEKELIERNQKISQLDNKCKNLEKQLDSQDKANKSLCQTIKNDCNRMELDFKLQVEGYDQRANQLKQQLNKVTNSLKQSQSSLQQLNKALKISKQDIRQKVSQIQQKQRMLALQDQKFQGSLEEWKFIVENMQKSQKQAIQQIKYTYETKIKQLQDDYNQKNIDLCEIQNSQMKQKEDQSAKMKIAMNLKHSQEKQQLNQQIRSQASQIQTLKRNLGQLQSISCQGFDSLNKTIDQARIKTDKDLAGFEIIKQKLFQQYQQIKSQNSLLLMTIELRKQDINSLQTYLQKQKAESLQKSFEIIELQAKIQEEQTIIRDLQTAISEEAKKHKRAENQMNVQFETLIRKREQMYKESCGTIIKTYEFKLIEQDKRSLAQVQSLRKVISGLKQMNKVKDFVYDKKTTQIENTSDKRIQRQNAKEVALLQKIDQMKTHIRKLAGQLQQVNQDHQSTLQKLKVGKVQLQKQTQKVERFEQLLETYLNSVSLDKFYSALQKLQEQSQEHTIFNLFIANVNSNVQRNILSNSTLEGEVVTLSSQLKQKDDQNTKLLAQVQRLAYQLEHEKQSTLYALGKQQSQKKSKQQRQNQLADNLRDQLCKLETQLQKYRQTVTTMESESKAKDRRIKQSQNLYTQQRDKLQKISKQYEEKVRKNQQLLNSKYNNLQLEKTKAQQRLNQQNSKLNRQKLGLERQIDNYRSSKNETNKVNSQKQDKIAQYEIQIRKQEENLNKQKLNVVKERQNVQKLLKNKDQLTQKNKELELRLEQLEKNKNTASSSNRNQRQFEQLKNQVTYLKEQNQYLKVTQLSLQQALKNKQDQLHLQRTSNQKMGSKIKEFEEINRSAIRVGSSNIREDLSPIKPPTKEAESSRIRQLSPNMRQVVEKNKTLDKNKILFSSQSLLDNKEDQRQFLIKSIADFFDKKCLDSNKVFSMNQSSKFRAFNLILSKTAIVQQSYLYLFRNKGTNNSENIFAFVTCKITNKSAPINALLISLTKKKAYPRKQNFDNKIQAIRFEYSGELVMAGTLKIKPNEKKLESLATKDKYFQVKKNSEIFDLEVPSVELSDMEIHQIELQ